MITETKKILNKYKIYRKSINDVITISYFCDSGDITSLWAVIRLTTDINYLHFLFLYVFKKPLLILIVFESLKFNIPNYENSFDKKVPKDKVQKVSYYTNYANVLFIMIYKLGFKLEDLDNINMFEFEELRRIHNEEQANEIKLKCAIQHAPEEAINYSNNLSGVQELTLEEAMRRASNGKK